MSDRLLRRRASSAALLIGALLLFLAPELPALQAAAEEPPIKIGNRWDGLDHQPRQADIGAAEQELGLSPSANHDRAVDNELRELGDQLLNAEQNDPAVNGQ